MPFEKETRPLGCTGLKLVSLSQACVFSSTKSDWEEGSEHITFKEFMRKVCGFTGLLAACLYSSFSSAAYLVELPMKIKKSRKSSDP